MSLASDLRAVMKVLLAPFIQLGVRLIPVRDPWKRFPQRVPVSFYGTGSQRDFGWYLEGESRVTVGSVEEIQEWLLGCEYVEDRELFHEHDFWQHPRTFEHLRRGDCEDHALWAWRKLVELGMDAELVSGRQLTGSGESEAGSGHVWVVFTRGTETIVFETVAKDREGMLRPLAEVRASYRPEVSVNGVRRRFAYGGYFLTLRERRDRGKAFRAAALAFVFFLIGACSRPSGDAHDTGGVATRGDSAPGAVAEVNVAQPSAFDSTDVVVHGACPFECCVYREWQLRTGAAVRSAPGTRGDSIDFLAAGTPVRADSGLVVLSPPGLVLVTAAPPKLPMAGDVKFQPGDTLELLNYIGEGVRRVRWKGNVIEVDEYWRMPDARGVRVLREPVQHWWTHVTTPQRRGWILMDSVRVKGADRCA